MPRRKSNAPKKEFMAGYATYDPSDGLGRGSVGSWHTAWEDMGSGQARSILKDESDTPLAILGFTSPPTMEELNKRFRELMVIHHPDKGGDLKMAQRIIAAWAILTNK